MVEIYHPIRQRFCRNFARALGLAAAFEGSIGSKKRQSREFLIKKTAQNLMVKK
jgi:hypothetical protein